MIETKNDLAALLEDNAQFRLLHEKHQEHERLLMALAGKGHLNEEEDLEEKRLKKEKLAIKDQMEVIARHYRETASA